MFAVIKTGGKQYKVAANDTIKIEKLDAAEGDIVTFDQVLMVGGDGADLTIGAPLVTGASVAAEFLGTKKQDTVLIVKKQRRQHFDRRNGHRQLLSSVRITEILLNGAKPSAAAAKPKKAAAPKAAPSGNEDKKAAKTAAAEAPAPETAEAKPAKKAAAKADYVDDVKLIGGVGPAIEKKLNEAGITSLAQIAAWKKADVARIDEELSFHGRIERDDWVGQAKDLVAGKPPRAKVDQAAAEDKAKDKE